MMFFSILSIFILKQIYFFPTDSWVSNQKIRTVYTIYVLDIIIIIFIIKLIIILSSYYKIKTNWIPVNSTEICFHFFLFYLQYLYTFQ